MVIIPLRADVLQDIELVEKPTEMIRGVVANTSQIKNPDRINYRKTHCNVTVISSSKSAGVSPQTPGTRRRWRWKLVELMVIIPSEYLN
jgi:hypothetical protein